MLRRIKSRTALALGLVAVVGAAAYLAGRAEGGRPRHLSVGAYGTLRAPIVAYQAAQAGEGYVLVAGDSHAELALPGPLGCGRALVNAGLSGAKADDYAAFLAKIPKGPRASVAVVTLGTNHLLRKRNPAGAAAADAYEADLARVVEGLRDRAGRVVVAAVPPVAPAQDAWIDRAGVANLTARQKGVCARLGCETADPYAGYREPSDFNTARAGASHDGLHLADYRAAYGSLDGALCR